MRICTNYYPIEKLSRIRVMPNLLKLKITGVSADNARNTSRMYPLSDAWYIGVIKYDVINHEYEQSWIFKMQWVIILDFKDYNRTRCTTYEMQTELRNQAVPYLMDISLMAKDIFLIKEKIKELLKSYGFLYTIDKNKAPVYKLPRKKENQEPSSIYINEYECFNEIAEKIKHLVGEYINII